MRSPFLLAAALALSMSALATPGYLDFKTVAIAPDGLHVASTEVRDDGSDSDRPALLMIRDLKGGAVVVPLPCAVGPDCKVDSPAWSTEGRLAFVVSRPQEGVAEIDMVDAHGGAIRHVLSFNGTVDRLRYGPRNTLAVLATAEAHKQVGRTEAEAPLVGDIGSESDKQRIAVVDGDALKFVSPPDLYVYEFDVLPEVGFVGTAAPRDGDSQWWVAKLYAFDQSHARVIFAPGPENSWPRLRCRPTEKAWRSSAGG